MSKSIDKVAVCTDPKRIAAIVKEHRWRGDVNFKVNIKMGLREYMR